MSTNTGALVSTSPTGDVAGVDAASAASDSLADSGLDCFADESADCRSAVDLFVERVSDASAVGFVVERPEPTDVLAFVPETVDVEGLPVDSEAPSLVADEDSDVPVDPDDVLPVDPDDELVDPDELEDPDDELDDDELDDDCPPSSAIAVPMPQVPTNPATPSEKATAPTRNATLAEFTSGPPPPWFCGTGRSSAAQPDVPETVAALTAIPMPVVGVTLGDLDIGAVDIAGLERRIATLHLNLVSVCDADAEGEEPSHCQRARGDHSSHACAFHNCVG